MLQVTQSVHRMNCVETQDPRIAKILRATVADNWMDSEAYKVRIRAGAFLQGYDEYSGWALVEFWLDDYQPFVDYVNRLIAAPDPTDA